MKRLLFLSIIALWLISCSNDARVRVRVRTLTNNDIIILESKLSEVSVYRAGDTIFIKKVNNYPWEIQNDERQQDDDRYIDRIIKGKNKANSIYYSGVFVKERNVIIEEIRKK